MGRLFHRGLIREADLGRQVDLCIGRSERIAEINPLARHPGNISINRTIQERLDRGESFALAYAGLDPFKPFNDRYGFTPGATTSSASPGGSSSASSRAPRPRAASWATSAATTSST